MKEKYANRDYSSTVIFTVDGCITLCLKGRGKVATAQEQNYKTNAQKHLKIQS